MTANTNLLNIRLFRDFEEVMREPGYKEYLPVSTSNYQYLLGHYDLKDEVACCRQKESGILCKEGHKKGFVVKLVDDSVTVVGNTCATTKFGVDSKIQKHASMYASENDRQARIERLGNLLGNKSKIINELRDACTPVYLLKKKIEEFMDKLGRRNCTKLQSMAKTSNGNVSVIAIYEKTQRLSNGDLEIEQTKIPVRIGTIAGLKLFDMENYEVIFRSRLRIEDAFSRARKLESNLKSAALLDQIEKIADYERVVSNAREFAKLETVFEGNDFTLFCYLDFDRKERIKAAELVCDRNGVGKNRAVAREWMDKLDESLRASNNAVSIRIA